MKKTLRLTCAIAFISAMCLSACNKAELIEDNPVEQPGIEEPQPSGWKVAISATMGGAGTKALAEDPDTRNLIATFETTDNIYVYNATKSKADSSPLHPDRNGAFAILTGTLSESYDEGDILVLCYNPEYIGDYGGDIRFDYTSQNGTLAAVADFAIADKTVSAAEAAAKELSGTVSFTNLQSIFKFTFTDGSSAVPVHKVTISTAQGQLVQTDLRYHSFGGMYKGEIRVTPAGTTTEPVYVALRNDTSADDTFYFEIEDGSGLIYKGEKAAPAGKIVNGKFYASTVILAQVPKPTVILTDSGSAVEPNDGNYGYLDAGSLTVSGTGEGYYFSWASQSFKSLTLSGASIICYSREPVSSSRSILNPIILEGDNYIITDADHAAVAYKSNFSGTEFSQFIKGNGTLTITASGTVGTKGFKNTYSSPVNVVASPGFTLTVSDGVDNGDGTTTWVYTVRPDVPGLTFDLTAGYPAIAGATKRDWEAGDAVFVFFEGVVAPKYLKMSYDGTGWTCTEMDGDTAAPGCLGLGNGGTGSMRAVFLPFGSNAAVSADGDGFVLDAGTEPFYLTDSRPYTVTSNTLSGNFEMALPEGYVQLYLPDPAADANAVIELREPHFTPQGIASIATDGTITHTRIAHGAPLKGYAYDRGYLFGGILAADARNTPADYRFTLVKGGFAGNYSHTAFSGLTFCTGVAEGRAFNLPSEAGWTPYTDFIPVDLGCDTHLGGQEYKRVYWANRNLGATADTGDGSYGDFFAWGELEPYYEAGYARETPGTHWRAGKEKGFAWASYSGFNPSGDGSTFTKYTGDDFATLQPADDAASQMLGGPWRIPTNTDWRCLYYTLKDEHNDGFVSEEVSDILSWTFSSESVAGYYVTSSAAGCEGNSIFLPLSGRRRDGNLYVYKTGREGGNYWSSSLYSTSEIWDPSSIVYKPDQAYGAAIDRPSDTGQGPLSTGNISRYNGRSVRPVMD